MNLRFIIIFLILGMSSLIFWKFSAQKEKNIEKSNPDTITYQIYSDQIYKVKSKEEEELIYITGNTEANQSAFASSQVNGQIKSLKASEGSIVKKGDLLATINSDDLDNALDIAQKALLSKQSEYELAQISLRRMKKAYEEGLIAKQLLDETETKYDIAQSNLKQAKLTIEQAKRNFGRAKIIAPIDGIISQKNGKVGDYIQAGFDIYEISQLSPLKIRLTISEDYIDKVKVGQKINIYWDEIDASQKAIHTTIKSILPNADKLTRDLVAIANISNKNLEYKANMFINGEIKTGNMSKKIIIPSEALHKEIQEDTIKYYVYKLDSNDRHIAHKQYIEAIAGLTVEVLDGLAEDDRIINAQITKTQTPLLHIKIIHAN